MYPIIKILGLELSTYGLCTSVGLVLMWLAAFLLSRRYKIKIEDTIIGLLVAMVGAFLGAHIVFGFTNMDSIVRDFGILLSTHIHHKNFITIIVNNFGGMVFYGGLLGGLGFGALYCIIRGVKVGEYGDCFAVGIPLFHVFGRIGCFFSGCCYGIESDLGFTTTQSLAPYCNYVNRFPVQLLESGLNLLLFAILLLLFFKTNIKNILIYVYLILYSIIRFFDEFLRGDTYRGIYFGLSTSQWLSIILFTVSLAVIIKYLKKPKVRYIK